MPEGITNQLGEKIMAESDIQTFKESKKTPNAD
jgi:hypothetical protein